MKVSFEIKVRRTLKAAVKEAVEQIDGMYWCSYGSSFWRERNVFIQVTGGGSRWEIDFSKNGKILVSFDGSRSTASTKNALGWGISTVRETGTIGVGDNRFTCEFGLRLDTAPDTNDNGHHSPTGFPFQLFGMSQPCEYETSAQIFGKKVSHEPKNLAGWFEGQSLWSIGNIYLNGSEWPVVQIKDFEAFEISEYGPAIVAYHETDSGLAWVAVDVELFPKETPDRNGGRNQRRR